MKRELTTIWIVVALVATASCSAVEAATEIAVRESIVISRSVVRLGDVADITCDNDADAQRLAALPLMPAPTADNQRFLRSREIEDLLAARQADSPPPPAERPRGRLKRYRND